MPCRRHCRQQSRARSQCVASLTPRKSPKRCSSWWRTAITSPANRSTSTAAYSCKGPRPGLDGLSARRDRQRKPVKFPDAGTQVSASGKLVTTPETGLASDAINQVAPPSLIVKPAEAEVFYFHEFLDAVVGTFSTEPRLFDAAKRCNLVRDEAGVNTDHSAFQPLGRSPNATDIATIEVARQTKFGIIGQLNCLLIGFELEQRC